MVNVTYKQCVTIDSSDLTFLQPFWIILLLNCMLLRTGVFFFLCPSPSPSPFPSPSHSPSPSLFFSFFFFFSSLACQVYLLDCDVVTKRMTVATVPILRFWETCSLLIAGSISVLRNFLWVHLIFRLLISFFFHFINLNSNFIHFNTELQSYSE